MYSCPVTKMKLLPQMNREAEKASQAVFFSKLTAQVTPPSFQIFYYRPRHREAREGNNRRNFLRCRNAKRARRRGILSRRETVDPAGQHVVENADVVSRRINGLGERCRPGTKQQPEHLSSARRRTVEMLIMTPPFCFHGQTTGQSRPRRSGKINQNLRASPRR